MEKIRALKEILYTQKEELIELKDMINDMAKNVSNTKNISIKAKFIISYLISLHSSNCQALLEISLSIILPFFTPNLVAKSL